MRVGAGWRVRVLLGLLLLLLAVTLGADTLHLAPADRAAAPYRFSVALWVAQRVPVKLAQQLWSRLPGQGPSEEERQARLAEYFQIAQELRTLRIQLAYLQAQGSANGDGQAIDQGRKDAPAVLEARIRQLTQRQSELKSPVEATLEQELGTVLKEQGLKRKLGPLRLIFPPVAIRLEALPTVLVVSPRDRILLQETHLLDSEISVKDAEKLEAELLQKHNLSALVVELGGLATYPSLVPRLQSLESALVTSAHEWLHQYWFFYPLGRNYFDSPEMRTLNETAAGMAGRDLGIRTAQRLGLNPPPLSPAQPPAEEGFSFFREMRQTRLTVDALLAQGQVEEAERHMEERRLLFVAHRYVIRKLNQAYFAFHGTYAESPASVSPIAQQLQQLRSMTPTVGEFVRTVAGFGSYQEFLTYLARKGEEVG